MNMFTRDFVNPRQDLPAEDPLGLEAWSVYRGWSLLCVWQLGPTRSFGLQTPWHAGGGCNHIGAEADGPFSMAASELINTSNPGFELQFCDRHNSYPQIFENELE